MRTCLILLTASVAFAQSDVARWEKEARNITITRDDWGIAHVHGKTDADAVFGMIYAQAEDDFNRVEMNYVTYLGRAAEAEGESKIYQDLRNKIFVDPAELQKIYATCPDWLRKLMIAWADGLNFYLYKHPNLHPKVITHFEPWMTLAFSEGSIGGDTERVNLKQLESFYGGSSGSSAAKDDPDQEPRGSNGIAVGPSDTATHHAMLLINPHTSFFFRSELQMSSDEGLNAYGAVTWGQFFVYQGFNNRVGWMHTSSGVDAIDEYLETVSKKGDQYFYQYGNTERPMRTREITVRYKTSSGMAEKKFTAYYSHHGPIVREQDGKWVAFRIMQEPMKALEQSFLRTKAHDYKSYLETMELKANSSNNTIFADADGDIAYFHGNFIPRRDPKFDWTKPVDGSNPETEWKGLLSVDETPHLLNPKTGWLFNVNNWPWTAAGPDSPKRENYPKYVENGGESARGLHALRILENQHNFTLDSFLAAAFDSYLPWFEKTIPALLKAWDAAPASDPLKSKLDEQIAVLRKWDYRWSADSVATSLAVFWGEDVRRGGRGMQQDQVAALPAARLLSSLAAASAKLDSDFGTWKTPWGQINRFQRVNDDIVPNFNDAEPSIPVPFTSSQWGSLASFGARQYPNTKKWYGTSGNSFVAVVEFGPKVRARAVTAGGESGDPRSRHFNDEAERYASGNLREVYYYPEQLKGHIEREYHPGE
ncbi:MAG TPA: acylase [Bryobacteraceae bacterium]|jgi:acyl-homoserine-lactone acylase|nr:acylase [Bryobacteraceae bacterium]